MQVQVVLDKVAKSKGMSMYALAKKLDVKPNALTVTKRLNYNPKLESLIMWAHALDCKVTDLFEVKGEIELPTPTVVAKTAAPKKATAKTGSKKKAGKRPTAKAAKSKN